MKLSRLFVIALLVGTLAAVGCGDSGSSGGSVDPNEVCNRDLCATSEILRDECLSIAALCQNEPEANRDECILTAGEKCDGG